MTADALRIRANNLGSLVFLTSLVAFFAIFVTNSISTTFDTQRIEAPLLYVIAANLILSWIVSQFAVRSTDIENTPERAIETGTAAYVFASASGALTTSATHLVEV